jgi:ATP-dependent DNA helicase DinG
MARKHLPGKLSDAFTKAADDFHDAMADYGDTVKGDFAALGRLEEIPSILEAPVRKVREAGAAITDALRADEEIIDPDGIAERARVKGAVTEITTTVGKLLKMGSSHVLWYEPTFSSLYLAPLSVSEVLRENLLTKTPVIATSATLTVGSGFDAMARSLGFLTAGVSTEDESDDEEAEIDPSNFQTLDVGSPFDSLSSEAPS